MCGKLTSLPTFPPPARQALEVLPLQFQLSLLSELQGNVMRCVRDQNGNHVVQKCIECVPPSHVHPILRFFYGNVVPLSMHPYGCRVIQVGMGSTAPQVGAARGCSGVPQV